MMRHRLINNGFTLVETVIVIALTAVMMLALTNLYINFNTLYVFQQTLIATAQSAGSAMNAVHAAILPANQVPASHTFASGTLSSDADTIVLELPTVNTSGAIIAGTYDHIAFYLTGTDLYQLIEANAASARVSGTKKVASLVESLTFTYDDPDFTKVKSVETDILVRLTPQSGPVETHLREKFYLRNI